MMPGSQPGTKPLVVTQGDPAGVGPEIVLKAWLARQEHALPPFGWVGNPEILRRLSANLGWIVPLAEVAPGGISSSFGSALPVISPADFSQVVPLPGQPDPASAPSTINSIRLAVDLVRSGQAGAVVTMPIAKHVLYKSGFSHPGHTEYLASLAAPVDGAAPPAVMLIWSPLLAVVPVTIHIPLAKVPEQLTTGLIIETGRIVAREYRQRFGIENPRLALAGLNPHAGENGAMGHEDATIVAPAVAQLRSEGIDATGPWPADTMFHERARTGYDVALGMYHDQVLIPVKTLAFDDGVNVTLGLPFIRTSPDHGTAFDIAGRGIARIDSTVAALKLAARLVRQGQHVG
jgi:4-hydroxythreonine-4-phosphate dehydrogenase